VQLCSTSGDRLTGSNMAQELYITTGAIGGVVGWTVAQSLGFTKLQSAIVVVVAVVIMVAVHLYSPAPNRTVFAGMGSPEAGYWGFSRDDDG